ncbi:hypothetical protein BJX68DRAFT_265566 [Aspergillus pseudodeflectus]|uniref:Uncharacterized protein n=1 Tax=Aspergillus pseudodeflectus TaxID=176178 RepID=A0ABR4KN43_9EURO
MRVNEGTKDGPLLYIIDNHNTKPHMIFHSQIQPNGAQALPSQSTSTATASFHHFSHAIDIRINGRDMVLSRESELRFDRGFAAPSLGGKKLIWTKASKWKHLYLNCVDEDGIVYATYRPHGGFSLKKGGMLELLGPCGVSAGAGAAGKDSGLIDEIIVTALVTIVLQIRAASAATG